MFRFGISASLTGFVRVKVSMNVGGGGIWTGTCCTTGGSCCVGRGLALGTRGAGGGIEIVGCGLDLTSGAALGSRVAVSAGEGPTDFSVLTNPFGGEDALPLEGRAFSALACIVPDMTLGC